MVADPWHYPRIKLAKHILEMFESGLSSALIFFAPRRMGKTEFLCKDIMPLAESRRWKVFYFSFLDLESTATIAFTKALADYAERTGIFAKTRRLLKKVNKVSGEAAGIKAEITFGNAESASKNMKEVIRRLAEKHNVLLLMDEVQVLAKNPANANFVAALRTVLDIHKDTVKVIFTGSSQEGLRRMFSLANAPFFHFGQNLSFPELDQHFTDHLVKIFKIVTKRYLDANTLWMIFQEMQKVPQLARALVERLALNPSLSMEEAKKQLLSEIFNDRDFSNIFDHCSALEQLLLNEIANGGSSLFGVETRNRLAKQLGISNLPVPSVQSSIRVLQRKSLIGQHSERGGYYIDDLNFKSWLLQSIPP